jgi:hypothetical protein
MVRLKAHLNKEVLMLTSSNREMDVFDRLEEEAPYLHTTANYLKQEMAEIFWNLCVESFLLKLYYQTRENPTWEEEEILGEDMPFETVAKYLLMLKDSNEEYEEWPGIYQALQEATQVPYGRNIGDLLGELPIIWEHRESCLVLSVMADIIDRILFYREKDVIESVPQDDRALMADAVERPPIKILA